MTIHGSQICQDKNENPEISEIDEKKVKSLGLDLQRIRHHQQRILKAFRAKINRKIPIEKPCLISNGGLLPWAETKNFIEKQNSNKKYETWSKNHLVTCIPGAGAGSRYFLSLIKFQVEFSKNSKEKILDQYWIDLFPFLPSFIEHCEKFFRYNPQYFTKKELEIFTSTIEKAYVYATFFIDTYSMRPKMSIPATVEGDSFLFLKIQEQQHLIPCLANIIIVADGHKNSCENDLEKIKNILNIENSWFVYEQTKDLSTIRFLQNGNPYEDENEQYSCVSAGHGELLRLFSKFSEDIPQAEALHIRNIDNIIGTSKESKNNLNTLGEFFFHIQKILEKVRHWLGSTTSINDTLNDKILVHTLCELKPLSQQEKNEFTPDFLTISEVYAILSLLFHWPKPEQKEALKLLREYCQKPLSVMGMVRRLSGDAGGGPIFTSMVADQKIKLCLEMTHASDEQAQEFFGPNGSCTHFNPVLVFFELQKNFENQKGNKVDFRKLFDEHFWLLTQREFKGKKVCYHETVLYELIGNSSSTNLIFVEAPRSLFKPHKSIQDGFNHDRTYYEFPHTEPETKTF